MNLHGDQEGMLVPVGHDSPPCNYELFPNSRPSLNNLEERTKLRTEASYINESKLLVGDK